MTMPTSEVRRRSAGILLHPTSLPGPFGIGDLGPGAYAWIDFLTNSRQTWWQILPLGPTGYGDSPYQCFSAFAGNPLLVSPQVLIQEGLLSEVDLADSRFPADKVDFGPVIHFKNRILALAWDRFQAGKAANLRPDFDRFSSEHALWLDDFALFMALRDAHEGKIWFDWPQELRLREPAALARARRDLAKSVGLHRFRQFLFFRQWRNLKQYANDKGIRIIGDAPIFVASDSADLWANPQYFLLDGQHRPRCVAGVPPDYFSSTGQLWGNPLYDWNALKTTGYDWWIARLRAGLEQVDLVRLDHFRGFEAYWEIPAGMPTAEKGQWVKGPGDDLLATLQKALDGLPLVAEDLGLITPEVEALRDRFELPGMRVLQFAFGGGPENPYLPHNYQSRTVVYTGTHDNDTSCGWYAGAQEKEKDHLRRYLAREGDDIAWDMIRLAWSSVADLAIAPLQDILSLGSQARMNLPGKPAGNWSWRYTPDILTQPVQNRLAEITELYGRGAPPQGQ